MTFRNSNNMMDFQFDTTSAAFVVMVAAMLAGIIVAFQNFFCKCFILSCGDRPILSSAPVTMIFAGLNAILILVFINSFVPGDLTFFGFKPLFPVFGIVTLFIYYVTPIAIGLMSRLETHSIQRRVITFFKTFVPGRFIACLSGLTFWVMSSAIFRGVECCAIIAFKRVIVFGTAFYSFICVDREGIKHYVTATLTNFFNMLLFFRYSHAVHYTGKQEDVNRKSRELLETLESAFDHNVTGNGKREGLKTVCYETISSQASWEQVEGSTTNAYDPERIMKRHECAALKGMI